MTDEIFDADDPAAGFPDLAAVLGSDAVWDEPPADLEDRIVTEITQLAGPSRRSSAAVPPVREGGRPRRWLVAVAAAVVALAGVGVGLALSGGDDDGPVGDVFALEATDLAADATGEVELTELRNGLRIILTVDDLPAAADGQFYEAWMSSAAGPVSAGTFHMRAGAGEIELWAGVVPSERYQRLAITLEDEDGDATSSGRVVLVADLSQP